MNYQQQVFSLIARLGGSKDKTVVDSTLCKFMGSLQGGVFLAQLLYWSDKGRGGTFYKSYKEWEMEIFLSKYEVKKAADKCVALGFLETKVKKANGDPTVHYTLLPDRFIDLILEFVRVEIESQNFDKPMENQNFDERKSKSEHSLTETTYTETNGQRNRRPIRAQKSKKSYQPEDYGLLPRE